MNPSRTHWNVLLIDDDALWGFVIKQLLAPEHFSFPVQLTIANTIADGIRKMDQEYFDVILLDYNLNDPSAQTGLDLFKSLQHIDNGAEIVFMSGEADPKNLLAVFRAGVRNFISKAEDPDDIGFKLAEFFGELEDRREILDHQLRGSPHDIPILGQSAAMVKLRAEIQRIVSAGVKDVLIQGETGSGKEIVARTLVRLSDPKVRLLPIHCGAISAGIIESELFGHVRGAFTGADRDRIGVFEAAQGGTVFLDEIGEMPLNQQAKLLRVLQERKVQRVGSHEERSVHFRTISATHVSLQDAVIGKRFREDLYYRIAREVIVLPPLRERTEDIPCLVEYFIGQSDILDHRRKRFSSAALALLANYSWPGNIRQLRAITESLLSRTDHAVVTESDVLRVLPEVLSECGGITSARRNSAFATQRYAKLLLSGEKRRFLRALSDANGSREEAARALGMSRATFFRKAKELGVTHSPITN